MRMKVLISLILIAAMAFGIGAGSYAWFTSTATSTNNVFATGTLAIAANETVGFTKDIENIYPIWEDSNTITVKNTGSLPLKFKVSVEASDSDLFKGDYPLQISINGDPYINVKAFTEKYFNGPIAPDQEVPLVISYKLPKEAGNFYQGKAGTLSFTIDATQTENTGWTQEYTPVEN